MLNWIVNNWDKLATFAIALGGAVYAVLKRIGKLETRMDSSDQRVDDHIAEDGRMHSSMEAVLGKLDVRLDQMTERLTMVSTHDAILEEMSLDIRELRVDIRRLLERLPIRDAQ